MKFMKMEELFQIQEIDKIKAMKLVLRNLDFQKCFNYLQLKYYKGLFFSERLIQEHYLKKGSFYTVVPDKVKEEHLYEFQWGGRIYPLYKPPEVTIIKVRNDSDIILKSSLISYINQLSSHFIGMEDYSATPNSQYIKKSKLKYYLLNNGKLFYLINKRDTSNKILKYYGKAQGYLFLCLLLKLSHDFINSISNIKLDDQITDQIFHGISSFFINAYDDEGFLIWCDNGQNDFLKLIEAHLGY